MAEQPEPLTLGQLCWLWTLNADREAGSDDRIAEYLEPQIQHVGEYVRPLEHSEIRRIAVEWFNE